MIAIEKSLASKRGYVLDPYACATYILYYVISAETWYAFILVYSLVH